jgi:hypothetical protein
MKCAMVAVVYTAVKKNVTDSFETSGNIITRLHDVTFLTYLLCTEWFCRK